MIPHSPRTGLALAMVAVASMATAIASRTGSAQPSRRNTETHLVRFERPVTAGTRMRIDSEGRKVETVERSEGRRWVSISSENVAVTLRAVERVLTVTERGKPANSELTVESLVITEGDATRTPIAAGTVLTIARSTTPGAEGVIRDARGPVEESVADALELVVSLSASDADSDAILGANQSRRVGERWTTPEGAASADLERHSGLVSDLRGSVRFLELRTVDTLPCAVVSAELTGPVRSMPNLPPGATLRTANLTTTFGGALPTDGTSLSPSDEFTMRLDAVIDLGGAPGAPSAIRIRSERSRRGRFSRLP